MGMRWNDLLLVHYKGTCSSNTGRPGQGWWTWIVQVLEGSVNLHGRDDCPLLASASASEGPCMTKRYCF